MLYMSIIARWLVAAQSGWPSPARGEGNSTLLGEPPLSSWKRVEVRGTHQCHPYPSARFLSRNSRPFFTSGSPA